MTTTTPGRWPIWTDGGATSTSFRAELATWVYRLADGTYLTAGPNGAGGIREVPSPERPTTPEGHPIPLQWNRLVAKLLPGPATDALVADLEAVSGQPDADLLRRLATAVAADPGAPALLVATSVRVECNRGGWVGRGATGRGVTVSVTYYL